jgi:hypothetical protein
VVRIVFKEFEPLSLEEGFDEVIEIESTSYPIEPAGEAGAYSK